MALIRCCECWKEVSEKSKSCLGCGAPINSSHEVSGVPDALVYNGDSTFTATRSQMGAIVVQAIKNSGFTVNAINESQGNVLFLTEWTMDTTASRVGSIDFHEISEYKFAISGYGKVEKVFPEIIWVAQKQGVELKSENFEESSGEDFSSRSGCLYIVFFIVSVFYIGFEMNVKIS